MKNALALTLLVSVTVLVASCAQAPNAQVVAAKAFKEGEMAIPADYKS